jgi:hypothetical protein
VKPITTKPPPLLARAIKAFCEICLRLARVEVEPALHFDLESLLRLGD